MCEMEWRQLNAGEKTEIWHLYIDGLVQERHNSSALAMELSLSCNNPLICHLHSLVDSNQSSYVNAGALDQHAWAVNPETPL